MARNTAFLAYVLDLLSGWGRVNARPQFSGFCLTRDGVIFALVLRDALYFKVDDVNRPDFERAGMAPFRYMRAGQEAVLGSYWEAPPAALDEPEELAVLADGALAAGRRKQARASGGRQARPVAADKVSKHRSLEPEVTSNRSSEKKARKTAKSRPSAR